jgi:hypothetical protein
MGHAASKQGRRRQHVQAALQHGSCCRKKPSAPQQKAAKRRTNEGQQRVFRNGGGGGGGLGCYCLQREPFQLSLEAVQRLQAHASTGSKGCQSLSCSVMWRAAE